MVHARELFKIAFTVLLIARLGIVQPSFANGIPVSVQGADVVAGIGASLSFKSATQATVVVFVSAKCPCSASHELALKSLHQEFSPKGFAFVGIHSNSDESPDLTRAHFTESAFPFPVIEDREAALANAFGALKTPHAFVISPAGEVLFQGGVDDSHVAAEAKIPHLKNAMISILGGRKPDPNRVRALGCVIKRSS